MTNSAYVESRRFRARRALLALTTILGASIVATPVLAQDAAARRNLDENGVDLTRGDFVLSFKEGSIGSGKGEIALIRRNAALRDHTQWDKLTFERVTTSTSSGINVVVTIGRDNATYDRFTGTSLYSLTPDKANGTSLTSDGISYFYQEADGTVWQFNDPTGNSSGGNTNFCMDTASQNSCVLLPASITSPDGATVSLQWDTHGYIDDPSTFPQDTYYYYRLNRVSNSYGYSVAFNYAAEATWNVPPPVGWYDRTSADFRNDAVSSSIQGSIGYSSPAPLTVNVTDMGGKVWQITPTSIKRPGESSPGFTVTRSGSAVTAVTRDGVTTGYSRSVSGNTATMTVTDALNHTMVIVSDLAKVRPTSVTNGAGKTTSFTYDGYGRLTRVTNPEGDYQNYTLDDHGNVTEIRQVSKTPGTPPDIVTTASFPCASAATCNKPEWTRDAKGNQTDYTYDTTTGNVATVTAPAPTAGAVRPKTTYSYTTIGGVQLVSGISSCRTTASCAGTADESRTTIGYNGNMLPTTITRAAGDNSLSATTTFGYDNIGNRVSVDGPLPGTGDTTLFKYYADRRLAADMAPDPDGSGPHARQAHLYAYNGNGQRVSVERGTVPSQATDWTSFVATEVVLTAYDAANRKASDTLIAGGAAQSVVQYSYDAAGRLDCSAMRMNVTAFGSLPASACTLQATGSAGPDRITKYGYDNADRVTKVTSGYGTADAADDVTATFTDNGQTATVTDGNGNLTTYGYDGFDRLLATTFPGGSYEQLGYDANGNVTSKRLRDGNVIGYGYDALNRIISKDLPNIAPHEYDITYAYDNFGNLTQALDSNTHVANFGYDALGRKVSEQSNWTTRQWQYDAAGRRTRLTWGDGFYVTYDYDAASNMTAIRENGGAALVTFGYDDLGRRTSLTRANGTVTSYGYDPLSRLSQLVQDLAGTAYDQTVTFGYNPVNQITSRTGSNDAYAWTGAVNTDRAYTVNGLNQYGAAGGMAFGYDGRGNLTTSGADSYGYTSENKLATAPGGYSMTYDPLGRYHWIANGPVTWMQYDGSDIIEERLYDVVARRYVFGPGTDEPLLWYEGAGTSDRRWLHADERGSIVAVSDNAGNAIAINRYDEYGIPQSGNIGRFQYTGQAWIPELSMYHYKARTYSPTLGRFLQTDPIRYIDSLNLYSYVMNDPVNLIDPSGNCVISYQYDEEGKLTGIYESGCNRGGGALPPWAWGGPSGGGGFGPAGNDGSSGTTIDFSQCTGTPCLNYKPPVSKKSCPPRGINARNYPIPPGYMSAGQRGNRFVRDSSGALQINPNYAAARANAEGIDWTGVLADLAIIAGSVGISVAGGPIGGGYLFDVDDVARAGWLVSSSAAKTAFTLPNDCRNGN